jgi:hypothetical protein
VVRMPAALEVMSTDQIRLHAKDMGLGPAGL